MRGEQLGAAGLREGDLQQKSKVMILEAKGIDLFYEAMGKEINNEVTGKTILVVMGNELVYEVLCFEWVDMEVVTIERDVR